MNSPVYNFEADFQRALEFSDKVGFHVPTWNAATRPILDSPEISEKLHGLMAQILGDPHDYQKLILKCVQVHHEYRHEIANIIGMHPLFTIGCVVGEREREWFSITEEEVTAWMIHGYENRTKYKMHAWLTLPSWEIIDFTLVPTLIASNIPNGVENNSPFVVIARHWSKMPFTYRPVAIGNDIPCKFGLGF